MSHYVALACERADVTGVHGVRASVCDRADENSHSVRYSGGRDAISKETVSEASPETAACMHWEDEEDHTIRTPAELKAGLEATWAMIADVLARYTVDDLGQVFEPPAS